MTKISLKNEFSMEIYESFKFKKIFYNFPFFRFFAILMKFLEFF